MPFADVGRGTKLYYETEGDGPPVVLVHEFAGSHKSWKPQRRAIRDRFRTVAYNCRGYPPSTVPDDVSDYSQDRSIADLHELLSVLGLEKVTLVGLSMGGNIALNFALRHPERVVGLVVAVTGAGSDDTRAFARDFEAVAARLEREGVRPVANDYLTGPTRIQLKKKRPDAWRVMYEQFCSLSPRGLANTIRGAILRRPPVYELEARLRQLRVPTLVITGDQDFPTIPPSRFLAETIPGAELLIFKDTGHTINLEEPDQFNVAIGGFLAR